MENNLKILTFGLVFSILGISQAACFALADECHESKNCEFIVPQRVGLYLEDSQKNNDIPVLIFTVSAGGGCDQVGELQITKGLKGGHALEVTINGYEIRRLPKSANSGCIAVVAEARGAIALADYMNNSQLELNILLNGKENVFKVNKYEDVFYLNPVRASNIISWDPRENMPEQPQYIGYMTKQFTDNLARIRLLGSYAMDSDLSTKLREYIRTTGYQPLDEKIPGYPGMDPLEDFMVFVPKKEDMPNNFKIIGEVKYHEIVAGEKTIQVGITSTRVYPFFVRDDH